MPGKLADTRPIQSLSHEATARRSQVQAVGSGEWLTIGVPQAADRGEGDARAGEVAANGDVGPPDDAPSPE